MKNLLKGDGDYEEVIIEESVTEAKLGVWSGIKFGFGFMIGACIATMILMFLMGGIIVGLISELSRSI